jgi:hypothetical protein
LTNLAQSQTFTVSGATAMITDVDHKGYINKGILNSQGYIDVEFQPTDENTMDADSILDTDAEFKLTGEAAESVTIKNDSVEKIDDNTFRYSFDGAFTTGAFTLALIENSFSDTGGFSNLGKTKTIQALVSQGTIVDPTPLTSQDRAGMNSKGYLLVDYTDPFGVGLDESSITDSDLEFRLGGKGAGSVVVYGDAEKFEQDGKTYWKYAYSGDFQDGLVTVNYIKDSWIDSAGNYGDAQMQEFAIFSQAQAFEIRLFGGVELDGGGFLPDLDKDGSPDKLVSLTGDVTITQDSVRNTDGEVLESSLTLDISATLELFYLGNIASAGGRFILASGSANPEPTDSIFGSDSLRLWGALKIESNLDALQNLGIEAEAEMYLKLNSTLDTKLESIRLEGIRGNELFTINNNGISDQLPTDETSTEISDDLRQAFVDNGIILSNDLSVLSVINGKSWKIYEKQGIEKLQYFVDVTDDGKLAIYSEYQTFELNPLSFGIGAAGKLHIGPLVHLEGDFNFEIGITEIELSVNAEMDFMMAQLAASGYLRINDEGVVGSLQLGLSVGTSDLGFNAFALSGTFQLEVNLTDSVQSIQTLDISKYGKILGLKEGYLDPNTVRVAFGGSLSLFSVISLQGGMEMLLNDEGLAIDMAMMLDLSDLGELSLEAEAVILYSETDPVFAFRAEAIAMLGIPSVNISGNAIVEINTGDQVYAGVDANTYRIGLEGSVNILSFEIGFKGEIAYYEDVMELRVDSAYLNFFDFITVEVSGYVRSDGKFRIRGDIDVSIDLGWPEISGGLSIELSDHSFSASVYGKLEVDIGVTLWIPFEGVVTISELFYAWRV